MAAVPRVVISASKFSTSFSVGVRRLSAVAAQQEIKKINTGIPVVVAHHTIKKAFTVHPKSRAFLPSLKHQWLTKTILKDGLPEEKQFDNSSDQFKAAVEIFKNSFLQQLAFQKELKKTKTHFEEEIRLGIFQNLLRIACGLSKESSPLRDTFLDVSPKIHTHWVRNHEFYNLFYCPDMLLWSTMPNNIYEKDIQSSIDQSIPGPYDPYCQNLFQHPIVHLRNFPGYQAHKANPYQHCHTLFLADVNNQTNEQIHSYGIMGMFGVLASKAMSDGILLGQHLPMPLTTQCVISNGKELVLMCYQLNTLSLQDDHGLKNFAWATEKMPFFLSNKEVSASEISRRSRKFYGSFDTENLPSVNEQCVKKLFSFICL